MPLRPPIRFHASKLGNSPEENEDAAGVVYSRQSGQAHIAVCDGASEAAFSREWAQILTDSSIFRPLDLSELDGPTLTGWLESCEEEWNRAVPWDRLPWHGEAKTRAGALAALLALNVDLEPNRSGAYPWRAAAVGDCCLFVVRDDELELAFPLDSSAMFNNTPGLICSNPSNNEGLWEQVSQVRGEFRAGDVIIIASDALSAWLFKEREAGGKPWETLLSLNGAEWEEWLQARRAERSMRNDDTTVVIVKI